MVGRSFETQSRRSINSVCFCSQWQSDPAGHVVERRERVGAHQRHFGRAVHLRRRTERFVPDAGPKAR